MLDINALERRWLKYKIKTYLPYGLGLIAVTTIIATGTWWLGSPPAAPVLNNPPAEINASQTANIDAHPVAKAEAQETTLLEPSMDFVQSFQTTPPAEATTPAPPRPAVAKPAPIAQAPLPAPKVLSMPEPPSPATVSISDKEASKGLAINRNENKLDINELQTRFKETSNPNLGLFIAQYYYDHGNYADAYNYALKTNTLNNRIDESWLIFAKSLVKMGKNDQAKRTLQVYISQSGSESAKELLNAIEKGNWK